MSRDKIPDTTIGEAKRKALAWGFRLIDIANPEDLDFDFAVERDGVTSLVRVRRLKHAGFLVAEILLTCDAQIRELRECTTFRGSDLQLWARGPARPFHRYRVLPDTIEELGEPDPLPADERAGELSEPARVPWNEKPVWSPPGEVREIPYVQECPATRERKLAMFRGYAKYIAGIKSKATGDQEQRDPGQRDPVGGEGDMATGQERVATTAGNLITGQGGEEAGAE
jgi:hypothetical protein